MDNNRAGVQRIGKDRAEGKGMNDQDGRKGRVVGERPTDRAVVGLKIEKAAGSTVQWGATV